MEGTYTWSSGEPFLFSHWDVGQPNNSGGNQDYVTMRVRARQSKPGTEHPGFWNDYIDIDSRDEFGVGEIVPEPSLMMLLALGILGIITFQKRQYRRTG